MIKKSFVPFICGVDVDRINAELFDVDKKHMSVVGVRRRHFMNLNLVENPERGRQGKALVYSIDDFFKLVFAMELSRFGLAPVRLVQLLNAHWDAASPILETVWKWHIMRSNSTREKDLGCGRLLPSCYWLVKVDGSKSAGFFRSQCMSLDIVEHASIDVCNLNDNKHSVFVVNAFSVVLRAFKLLEKESSSLLCSIEDALMSA